MASTQPLWGPGGGGGGGGGFGGFGATGQSDPAVETLLVGQTRWVGFERLGPVLADSMVLFLSLLVCGAGGGEGASAGRRFGRTDGPEPRLIIRSPDLHRGPSFAYTHTSHPNPPPPPQSPTTEQRGAGPAAGGGRLRLCLRLHGRRGPQPALCPQADTCPGIQNRSIKGHVSIHRHPTHHSPKNGQDEQARLSAEKEIRLLRLLQPCPQVVRCVDAALRPGSTHNCQVDIDGWIDG